MTKSETIQQVIDRTVKDITLLKEEVIANSDNKAIRCFYIDNSVMDYLVCLRQLLASYKAKEAELRSE